MSTRPDYAGLFKRLLEGRPLESDEPVSLYVAVTRVGEYSADIEIGVADVHGDKLARLVSQQYLRKGDSVTVADLQNPFCITISSI